MNFSQKNPNLKYNIFGGGVGVGVGGRGRGSVARISECFTKNPNLKKIEGLGGGWLG